MRKQWTKEMFVQEILKFSKDGIAPASSKHSTLRGVSERLFGSWADAVSYSGLVLFLNRPFQRCAIDGCNHIERNRGSKYCEKHYGRNRRNGVFEDTDRSVKNINCIYCGEKLNKRQYKFCSERCATRYYRNNPIEKKCVICKKDFQPLNKGIDKVTCSEGCEKKI